MKASKYKRYRKFAAVLMLVSFIFATVSPASGEALEYIDAKKSASGTDGNASADGAGSLAAGYNSQVTAQDAVALGAYACATAVNSVALGFNSCASESDTVSVGNASCSTTRRIVNVKAGTSATDAVNYGQIITQASYEDNTLKLKNAAGDEIVSAIISGGSGVLWEAGETGTGSITTKSGDNHATKDYAIAMGLKNNASGEASTVLGFKSTAEGNYSLAAGFGAEAHGGAAFAAGAGTNADGYAAVALGQDTTAGTNAVALGYATKATAKGSTSTGYGSEAYGEGSFAGGGHVTNTQAVGGKAYGESSFAFGTGAVAGSVSGSGTTGAPYVYSGNYTFAFGQNAVADKDNAIALGSGSSAGHANSVALGSSSVTTGEYEVSIGDAANNISRRLTNLAEGSSTNDAVNYGQFKKAVVAANYSGGVLTMTNKGGETVFSQAFTSSGTIPGAVVYDNPDTKTKITLNAGGDAVTVTNVADGTADSDAAAYGQIKTAVKTVSYDGLTGKLSQTTINGTTTEIGTLTSEDINAVHYNTDKSEIALAGTAGTKISNLKAGDISETSTDAINGGQLYTELAKKQDTLTAAQLAAVDSGITAEKVAAYETYADKISTLETTVGNASIGLVKDVADIKASDVMNSGITAAKVAEFDTNIKNAVKTVNYDASTGRLTQTTTDGTISEIGTITGKDSNAVHYNADKSEVALAGTAGTKISNLKAGDISETSTDAINGSQLYTELAKKQDTLTAAQLAAVDSGITAEKVAAYETAISELETNKADKASTLAGYGITDAYTKTEVEQRIASGGAEVIEGKKYAEDDKKAKATGGGAFASGYNNVASGDKSTAVGYGNVVTGNSSGAFGDPNVVSGSGSYAVGNNNTIAQNDTFVFGSSITTTQANSVVLGSNSTDRAPEGGAAGVVSVGSATELRQIINVAAGTQDTDVVNVKQMNDAIGSGVGTRGVAYDDNDRATITLGNGSESSVTRIAKVADGINPIDAVNKGQLDNLAAATGEALGTMRNELGAVSTEVKEVGAISAALSGLHYAEPSGEEGDKFAGAVAYGGYRGESAAAIGLAYKPSPNFMLSASTSVGNNQNAYNAGFSYKFGKGETAATRASLQKQVKYLNDKITAQDAENAELKGLVKQLFERIEKLEDKQ